MLKLIEKYHITVLDTSDEVIQLAEKYKDIFIAQPEEVIDNETDD